MFLCVFLIKSKFFVVEANSGLHKRELLKYHESFPVLVFTEGSVKRNSIIMISKGYHYVINFGIVSNFYISIGPVYSGSCARIYQFIAGELRWIWVKFWQGIIGTTSIPVHFIHNTIKVSKYYFVFISPVFISI